MIVDSSEILRTIKLCKRAYNTAKSQRAKKYACKVAIIELCGWVEVTLDDIMIAHAAKHLHHPADIKKFREIVDRNSGFQYNNHLLSMYSFINGRSGFRSLETEIDSTSRAGLESALSTLKPMRNDAAHTHMAGAQATYFAPSRTEQLCKLILAGFEEFERVI